MITPEQLAVLDRHLLALQSPMYSAMRAEAEALEVALVQLRAPCVVCEARNAFPKIGRGYITGLPNDGGIAFNVPALGMGEG